MPSSPLPTRRLGTTDMYITRVGFGAWAIGGAEWSHGWGDQDDRESIAAIRHAIERGVNWIDTAAVYGLGHSEEIIAKALAEIPKDRRPYVFTKCGLVWNEARELSRVGKAESVRREAEASLKRLGVERLDLLQMHWPADEPIEEYWQTLLDLKTSGKVRAIGLSNHSASQLAAAEALGHVDTLQPPFSAIRRKAAQRELPWCAEHGTGVIVYSPMQSGLLTGHFSLERAKALPENDWRSKAPDFTDNLPKNLALAEALKPIAQGHNTTQGSVAVAWALSWPGVTGAIVGARRADQVDGWIDAATLELNASDLDAIQAAIASSGAGVGPDRPAK